MIHQKMNVEVGDPDQLGDRPVSLPEIAAPMKKDVPVFLVFDNMARTAGRRKDPSACLPRVRLSVGPANAP